MNNKNPFEFTKGIILGLLVGGFGGYAAFSKSKKMSTRVWMWKVKSDIYRKLRELKNPKQADFEDIVDEVIEKYQDVKDIGKEEMARFSRNLKKKWRYVKRRFAEEMENTDEEEDEEAE